MATKFDIKADTAKHIKRIESSLAKLRREAETNDTVFKISNYTV
jgi:hypothetical protein